MRRVKCWSRLPSVVLESLSMEMVRAWLDMALGHLLYMTWLCMAQEG